MSRCNCLGSVTDIPCICDENGVPRPNPSPAMTDTSMIERLLAITPDHLREAPHDTHRLITQSVNTILTLEAEVAGLTVLLNAQEEENDEDYSRCLTEGCTEDPNDGEGFDGYCGNCADRREANNEGIES